MAEETMIACPLCSTPSFSTANSLCFTLVNITSKRLRCTLCEEELNGLDKFTLHLLSHMIQNSDFKKCLVNDGFSTKVSPCVRSIAHPEPLNLVKDLTTNQQVIHQTEPKTLISHKFSPHVEKRTDTFLNERPSLKIDNEVMIFFKPNGKSDNNSKESKELSGRLISSSLKPALSSLSSGNPLCLEDNRSSVVINNKNTNVAATDMPTNFCLSSERIPHSDIRTSSPPTIPLPDIISLKQDNLKKRPLETNELLKSNANEFETVGLRDKPFVKSSFLSPKGERVLGFRCDICSLVFPDEHIMLMHRQLIHIEISGDPLKTNRFKCHLCSKSFVMRGSLMVHMRVAHFGGAVVARLVESKQLETNAVSPDSAQYNCQICSKGFKKEYQLTQHEKLHDGKQCDICLKTFTTKYFLRKHKRLHTGEMPYTCNICSKSFTFQQSYHKHLLYHSDEKPYSCAECGRAFKELSTLHNHQRIHTGEKPFSCETCGKCFRQRVSYLVHRRIHTGIMPYKCHECGKTFRYKVSERTHKCTLSTLGPTADPPDSTISEGNQDTACVNVMSLQETTNAENLTPVGTQDQVMNDSYPEPPDFFSLVMSPVDRLQHLSLSGEETADVNTSQHRIDSEALKQLLYDVADYT